MPSWLTARHLRLLCLCEGFALDARPGLERLVQFNGGAVSRSILDLQYWTTTSGLKEGGKTTLQDDKNDGNRIRAKKHSETAKKIGKESIHI